MVLKVRIFLYQRYDGIPVHVKTRLRPIVNSIYFSRFVRAKKNARKIISKMPAPRTLIPRNLGFTQINFLNPKDVSDAVSSANQILSKYKEDGMQQVSGKPYLRIISSLSSLTPNSPIVKIAMNDELLSMVTSYLGVAPQLNSINVMWSPPSVITEKSEGTWSGSQLFHIDGDSDGIVKVWILCNKVKEENGPTTLIPADSSLRISKEIKYSPRGKVANDDPFKNFIGSAFKAVGEPGTVLATDTARCFHQGSRTELESERLVIMYFFDTFRSSWYLSGYQNPIFNRNSDWNQFISNLPSYKKDLFKLLI
jgi:hypothetical protein